MAIEETIRSHRSSCKDIRSNKRALPFNNVNANLNFLTIDDVIYRCMS
jgi:hypothetical protein